MSALAISENRVRLLMALNSPDEELLRAEVLAAQKSLDAARDALVSNQVTKDEAALLY